MSLTPLFLWFSFSLLLQFWDFCIYTALPVLSYSCLNYFNYPTIECVTFCMLNHCCNPPWTHLQEGWNIEWNKQITFWPSRCQRTQTLFSWFRPTLLLTWIKHTRERDPQKVANSTFLLAGEVLALNQPCAVLLPLTFASIILVLATSRGVVTAAANPPEHIKMPNTSETLFVKYACCMAP